MKFTNRKKYSLNYIEVDAILRKIGNQKPYFSLTGRIFENGRESVSGVIHEEILKAFPQLEDFVSLHLSDIDGKPMHSFENGKYWAGFTKYQETENKNLSKLWRISEKSAQRLSYDSLVEESQKIKEDTDKDVLPEELFKNFHDRQLRRWKQEADNIIKKYNLEIVAD
jgi:hypothetical protein